MGNLIRNLSSLIGGHADAVPVRSEGASTPPDADLPPQLPLVPYAAPREEVVLPPARARRARAVGLLRSAAPSTVTSRTVPTLPSVAVRQAAPSAGPLLTETERIRLQVMQAQIQLSILHLYDGPIDGHMSPATATAVRYFQTLKGVRATGTLAAGTLAALGVPAII